MTKRVKHVHRYDMVAHLWAHQSQDSARNPCRNFYFDGDTIYSYGSHFPIARHVETKRGRAVLFTTRNYSVTTSGHKSTVRCAIPSGVTVFHVEHPTERDRRKQFSEYRARFVELARKYTRAQSKRLSKNNSYSFVIPVIVRSHAEQTHGSDGANEVS